MPTDQNSKVQFDPENQDAEKLGEQLLNSPMWVAFHTDSTGSYIKYPTKDSFQLIVEYFADPANKADCQELVYRILERTKLHIQW